MIVLVNKMATDLRFPEAVFALLIFPGLSFPSPTEFDAWNSCLP